MHVSRRPPSEQARPIHDREVVEQWSNSMASGLRLEGLRPSTQPRQHFPDAVLEFNEIQYKLTTFSSFPNKLMTLLDITQALSTIVTRL
jgi:hypothetical protein